MYFFGGGTSAVWQIYGELFCWLLLSSLPLFKVMHSLLVMSLSICWRFCPLVALPVIILLSICLSYCVFISLYIP